MGTQFAFNRQQSIELYNKIKTMVDVHNPLVEQGKMFILIAWFVVNLLIYGVYVNLASTQGYFLSRAEREMEELDFAYNISTLNMAEYQRQLWNAMDRGPSVKKINIVVDLAHTIDTKNITIAKK